MAAWPHLALVVLDEPQRLQRGDDVVGLDGRQLAQLLDAHAALRTPPHHTTQHGVYFKASQGHTNVTRVPVRAGMLRATMRRMGACG